jgi:hypothetical protein
MLDGKIRDNSTCILMSLGKRQDTLIGGNLIFLHVQYCRGSEFLVENDEIVIFQVVCDILCVGWIY